MCVCVCVCVCVIKEEEREERRQPASHKQKKADSFWVKDRRKVTAKYSYEENIINTKQHYECLKMYRYTVLKTIYDKKTNKQQQQNQ